MLFDRIFHFFIAIIFLFIKERYWAVPYGISMTIAFLGSSGLPFRVRFCRKQHRLPDVFYEFYCIPFRKTLIL